MSCIFASRRKGEDVDPDAPLTRHIEVHYKDLEKVFHLPLKEAAREIGLGQTTFKKACRSLNIVRWPYAAMKTQHNVERLLQQASMADTSSYDGAGHAGPVFQHGTFPPLDAPSSIGSVPLEAGPPRKRTCTEAVMEYLDGPSASSHLATLLRSEVHFSPIFPRKE
jgi:hypothetical protein